MTELRRVLRESKLAQQTKSYITNLDDDAFREKFLKRIHFDCGATETRFLARQVNSRVSKLLHDRGGVNSQTQACTANVLLAILQLSTHPNRDERYVDRNDLEKLLETATNVTLNRAQFESFNHLVEKALSATVSSKTDLSSTDILRLSPVSETPLPAALATREKSFGQLYQALETFGICWIAGAAGMGKTIAARVIARENGGDWASINLRGQSSEQISQALLHAANSLKDLGLQGLIIDDLAWVNEPAPHDSLCYLFHSAKRSDVLLVIASSELPSSDFLFACELTANIAHTLFEFSEGDIREILAQYGVGEANWARYTHLVSGGGHPQLAIAFIQSMEASKWKLSELQTLDALLLGSPAIDDLRRRTRERLLNDLPTPSRQFIERLSLKAGGFSRELAIDMGKVEPQISDPGIILDTLVGSWVDQHEGNMFSLSPLLSGFAAKTLGTDDKERIQSTIADSLTKGPSINLSDMNSALLAAWASKNDAAILKLCMAILGSDFSELEMLAPHLPMFALFKMDRVAYPSNPSLNQMIRGVQLLLLNQISDSPTQIRDALRCFADTAETVANVQMRDSMKMLVYSKLLLQGSGSRLGIRFTDIISELDRLLMNEGGSIPEDMLVGMLKIEENDFSTIGFMFLIQALQIKKISDLHAVFDFLDTASSDLRSRLFSVFSHEDFEVEMLVTGAWLNEDKDKTIDPTVHSKVFERLEDYATNWGNTDLAVSCHKFRAIILDEYGADKNGALSILEDALSQFGQTNSELVRAKAKVLYRAEDHSESLALSKQLIESDAPLNDVEKAFLGRDAAISAENEGDLKTARRYYLYGSEAARKLELPDMSAMYVGLLADAALASWLDGDRKTCLQDFVYVLHELNKFSSDASLRATHCHAVVRHVLLWLNQDATGEKHILANGEETKIRPGCVSNPNPNPAIANHHIAPIEMAWYMLATVENNALLDAGITSSLERYLPNGPVLEGQFLLCFAKMHKAMSQCATAFFVESLREAISYFAYSKASGAPTGGLDIMNVTYGAFPRATKQQQEELTQLTEQYVLIFCFICMAKGNFSSIAEVSSELACANDFTLRPIVLDRLRNDGPVKDYHTRCANLISIHTQTKLKKSIRTPKESFELAFMILQIAQQIKCYKLIAETLSPWLIEKWEFILQHQRFLLNSPKIHERGIMAALQNNKVPTETNVTEILIAVLPTLGITNQDEVQNILKSLP